MRCYLLKYLITILVIIDLSATVQAQNKPSQSTGPRFVTVSYVPSADGSEFNEKVGYAISGCDEHVHVIMNAAHENYYAYHYKGKTYTGNSVTLGKVPGNVNISADVYYGNQHVLSVNLTYVEAGSLTCAGSIHFRVTDLNSKDYMGKYSMFTLKNIKIEPTVKTDAAVEKQIKDNIKKEEDAIKTKQAEEMAKKKQAQETEKKKQEEELDEKRLAEEANKREKAAKQQAQLKKDQANKKTGNNKVAEKREPTRDERYEEATKKYQNSMRNGNYESAIKELDEANRIKPVENYDKVRQSMETIDAGKKDADRYKKDMDKSTAEFASAAASLAGSIPDADGQFISLSSGTGIGTRYSVAMNALWGHFAINFGASFRRSPLYQCNWYEYKFMPGMNGGVDGRWVSTEAGKTRIDVYAAEAGMGIHMRLSKKLYIYPKVMGYIGGTRDVGGTLIGIYPSIGLYKRKFSGESDFGFSFDFMMNDKQADVQPPSNSDNWMSRYPGDLVYRNYFVLSFYFVPGFFKMMDEKH